MKCAPVSHEHRLGRYLAPEPMLLRPGFAASNAASGQATPSYSYAYNNPLGFVDPTGLYSWRRECASRDPLGIIQRGFVATRHASRNNNLMFFTNNGAVGFDTQWPDACRDCQQAKDIKRRAERDNSRPDLQLAFDEAKDCWNELIKEVCDMCRQPGPPVKKTAGSAYVCR